MDRDKAAPPDRQWSEEPNETLLPVSSDVIAYCMRFGMSEGDAIRAIFRVLRPGGPLDDANYLTACGACGVQEAKPLRWFHDRKFACECGGKFDDSAIHAFNEAMIGRDYKEAGRILHEFFRPVEYAER